MPVSLEELRPQLERLLKERDNRAVKAEKNSRYYDGKCPIPRVVEEAQITNSFRLLMPMSDAPWGSVAVDSVQDRLEVSGLRVAEDGGKAIEKALWDGVWQRNAMDAWSSLGHNSLLVDGRVYATVWPDDTSDHYPEIILDNSEQMVVEYRHGRHQPKYREAALRHWVEDKDDEQFATVYRPDGLYKLKSSKSDKEGIQRIKANGVAWEPRDDDWITKNPYGVVPVVELATNRRLVSGRFSHARGEFEHCTGLIDRINLLTYLGLVVAIWMGFPLRGVIGEEITSRILKDDDGNPIIDPLTEEPKRVDDPPFKARPDEVVQFENPKAKVFQLEAADRNNLSVYAELDQYSTVTKTPRHYLPMQHGMANLSAEAINASEGGLHAKVKGIHQPFIGEGWEEVERLAGLMLTPRVILPSTAEIQWKDHESRSIAERADAATKVASIEGIPWQMVAEKYLSWTQSEISRGESMISADGVFQQLLDEINRTPADSNGNALTAS